MGLIPLKVAIWGPFVLLNFDAAGFPEHESETASVGNEWLGSSSEILSANGIDSSLSYVCRREYTIECNWKVGYLFAFFVHSVLQMKSSLNSFLILVQ